MKTVLSVCIGNICRSPMAEGILANALPHMQIRSAGIGALVGHQADPMAIELMRRRDIDISRHIARQINQTICREADLILVMTQDQRRYLENLHPFTRGKIFRIAESERIDVPDPYQKNERAFQEALSLIDAGAKNWIERILKITKMEQNPV